MLMTLYIHLAFQVSRALLAHFSSHFRQLLEALPLTPMLQLEDDVQPDHLETLLRCCYRPVTFVEGGTDSPLHRTALRLGFTPKDVRFYCVL